MKGPAPSAFRRRAILVAAVDPREPEDRSFEELELLAGTAGGVIAGRIVQKLSRFHSGTLIGSGKVEEVKQAVARVKANVVIFDNNLAGAQVRNLEKAIGIPVMDRTELILDVFATHARSSEAKLQVELAQLRYMLPRLVGRRKFMEQIHIGGAGDGAIAAGRGPGEMQIEYDRRLIRRRIFELQERIREVEKRRERLVRARSQENFTVALVGYTNAGKSTLMNALTRAGVYVDDKLFSTLDTRTKTWELSGGLKVLLSDTVGFIQKLPHHLVNSFHATLEEVREANLLLHVTDASDPEVDLKIEAVRDVLKQIGCEESPTVLVMNKVDRIASPVELNIQRNKHPQAVFLSARKSKGLDGLEQRVLASVSERVVAAKLKIPVTEGRVLAEIQDRYAVSRRAYANEHMVLEALIPRRDMYKYEKYTK